MRHRSSTLALAAVAVAGFAPTSAPALAHAAQAPRCGLVAFAAKGEDGAFQITARDTNCTTARSVAGASRPARFRRGDPRYTELGFACAGRSEQLGGHGKEVVAFQCSRARSLVSFLRA